MQLYITRISLYQWPCVLFSFNKIHARYEIIRGNVKTTLYRGGLQVWLKAEDILNEQLWRFERRDTPARGIGRGSQITQRIGT
jgi:hypothetical protein